MTYSSEKNRITTEIGRIETRLQKIDADLATVMPLADRQAFIQEMSILSANADKLAERLLQIKEIEKGESGSKGLETKIDKAGNTATDFAAYLVQIPKQPEYNQASLWAHFDAAIQRFATDQGKVDELRNAGIDSARLEKFEKQFKSKEFKDNEKKITDFFNQPTALTENNIKEILKLIKTDAALDRHLQGLEMKLLADMNTAAPLKVGDMEKWGLPQNIIDSLRSRENQIAVDKVIADINPIAAVNSGTISAYVASLKTHIDKIPSTISTDQRTRLNTAVETKIRKDSAKLSADDQTKLFDELNKEGIASEYWGKVQKEFRENREGNEQTAIKKDIAKIKKTGSIDTDGKTCADIGKRIEDIGAPADLVDLLKAKIREYYEQLGTQAERDTFISKLKTEASQRFYEEGEKLNENNKIKEKIDALPIGNYNNAADWKGAADKPVEIYESIVKVGKDAELVTALVDKLVLIYSSQADNDARKQMIDGMMSVPAPGVPNEISGPLSKQYKEKTRVDIASEKVKTYLRAGINADFRAAAGNEFNSMSTLAQELEAMGGDKAAENKLKEAVVEYYNGLLTPQDRSNFVTKARGKGLGKYINDELWKSTLKDVEASKETIESVMPILADYVDKALGGGIPDTAIATIEGYFKSDVMPAVVTELRTGIPIAAEQELLAEFIKAVQHGEKSNDYLDKIQTLRKNLVGTIIPQMFPKFGLSPYEQYSGIAPAANAVAGLVDAKGVLSLTNLKSYIETQVDAAGGVNISRNSREFPFIVQTITETVYTECMAELHDAKEIKKKEDEVDAIQEKKKKKEMAKVMNTLKWGVGFVGGGVLFGSGLGFLVNSSYWTATGSAMIGTSLGGLATVGKGLFEWFNNSDVKKLDSEWKMARAEFEIQKSQAVMASQKREMQIGNYFEGVLRDVFYPAQKKGREALFGRSAKMRQDMVNMQPPKLATFSL